MARYKDPIERFLEAASQTANTTLRYIIQKEDNRGASLTPE